jgi:ABC-2 type transport system ATP-binding protein
MTADAPLVQIKNLCKTFEDGQKALDSICADFPCGKIVGLVGPDGAGKTTLMRIMAGLLKPTSGSVAISGFDTISQQYQLHQIISYMPQKFGLYEDLSVLQNLNLYADLQGLQKEEKKKAFAELLQFTHLQPFTERLAKNLSGGMKQKLGLACALLRKPKLLLLDEPTVGVDPISRRELWKIIVNLVKEQMSVLCSTAYLDEAERCQEVLLLNEGKLLFHGKPEDLTNTLTGRTFHINGAQGVRRHILSEVLQDSNIIDGVIQGDSVRIVVKAFGEHLLADPSAVKEKLVYSQVPPRFEDAFLDKLGGVPKGVSPFTDMQFQRIIDEKPIVEAVNLTKRFGNFTAAKGVTFSVSRGEIFGLLGPNGAGKSTTFKMLCGLLTPTEGSSTIAGVSLQEAPSQARAKIGYMAQKFSLYGNMTVIQNLRFFSKIYPHADSAKVNSVEEMISIFSFAPFINVSAAELPLGYKQRLALACAVMHRPQVLFLDEPTSGVDPITRREFWGHINAMVESGVAIIITTHFMDEAEYCDRIGLINNGQLIRIGTPDELKTAAGGATTLEDAFITLAGGE